jgi:hypothetical protein
MFTVSARRALLATAALGTVVALIAVVALDRGGRGPAHGFEAARAPADLARGASAQHGRRVDEIDPATVREHGRFKDASGRSRVVFTGYRPSDGKTCLVVRGVERSAGSCAVDLFERHPVAVLETFTAGPGGEPLLTYEVFGLAASDVTRVDAVDTAGRSAPVHVAAGRALFLELDPEQLRNGVRIAYLVAHRAEGLPATNIPVATAD